jgi:hypothetical protein
MLPTRRSKVDFEKIMFFLEGRRKAKVVLFYVVFDEFGKMTNLFVLVIGIQLY